MSSEKENIPTREEERAMLLEKLQWSRMKLNEWGMEWQIRFHEHQQLLQAMIDHLSGDNDDDE